MDVQTNAMAGPVRERFTKARLGDELSRGCVNVARDHLRRKCVARGFLRSEHQRVDLVLPLVRRGPDCGGNTAVTPGDNLGYQP